MLWRYKKSRIRYISFIDHHVFFFFLKLSVWLGLLASVKGLLSAAADCDSRPPDLLLLQDTLHAKSEHDVVVEGFIKSYNSPEEFSIQVRSSNP